MNLQFKEFPGKVVNFDDATLTITHFISTETQDSGGDIMLAKGMKVRGKPVVLFQHGQDPVFGNEPIAKPMKFEAGVFEGKTGILATTQYFDDRKLTIPTCVGQRLYMKAKDDTMPNWSIGFNSTKEHPVEGGRVVDEWELHEYSQVAVGMNKEATTLALKAEGLPVIRYIVKANEPDETQPEGFATLKEFEEKTEEITYEKGAETECLDGVCKMLDGKPFPSEHSCRLKSPVAGAKTRRSNGAQEHDGKKYDVIYQLQGGKWVQQAYRYPKEHWTSEQAAAHCKSHDGSFSAATGKENPPAEIKSGKAPHLLAHKGIHAFHKEMLDDLKEAAKSDDLMDRGVETRAKEALEDFADGAGPHVEKYVKAVREMGKDDVLPAMEGTEEPERKGGPGSGRHPEGGGDHLNQEQEGAVSRIKEKHDLDAYNIKIKPDGSALLIGRSRNGDHVLYDIDPKGKESQIILPIPKGLFAFDQKDYSAPHRMLHKVRDDMIKAIHAHKGNKSVVPEHAAKEILAAHHEAALPHAKEFIKSWRESHSAEHKPEADPAAPAEKVLKIKPQAQEKKPVLRVIEKQQPEPAITPELVKQLVKDGLSSFADGLRAEMRRLSGKVTK